MKIAFGSDHAGFTLKKYLIEQIKNEDYIVLDVGNFSKDSCDYPIFANRVCEKVLSGEAERGILICGTGIGMSITSNRYSGIRAALCHDEFTASRARLHNDAQIITMGGEVLEKGIALKILKVFLSTDFDVNASANERHVRRNKMIDELQGRKNKNEKRQIN